MQSDKLVVSEQFYSIQGEGASVGVPAVFLRLAGCNLRCPGFTYIHPETGEHLGCDTAHVWQQGESTTFVDIMEYWQEQGWTKALLAGAHLVITGGEPMIQQKPLQFFFDYMDETLGQNIFIEMETNGTLPFSERMLQRISQFNVSPKLQHSGESRQKAYNPAVLNTLAQYQHVYFKFVVTSEADVEEILADYVLSLQIPHSRICLMPEGGTKSTLQRNQGRVVELCKKYQMRFSPRLHILLWDEATGV